MYKYQARIYASGVAVIMNLTYQRTVLAFAILVLTTTLVFCLTDSVVELKAYKPANVSSDAY